MPVMKPYLMIISILLIMVQKTPGGLFRFHRGKSQEPWNPCKLYQGMCRNTCRKYEIQYLTCPNAEKCCLKFSVKITSSNKVKEDYGSKSNPSVTNTSGYSKI
ncbi:beta-defensin 116 [Cynocephalus volans]|uniref:beta-defensin 116 n=1 Tax=Cynocephalus volans TaxID=110931 RepID=UPI002FCB3D6A